MADYPGSNSTSTVGANLKEVYPKNKAAKKNKFEKILKAIGK